MCAIDAWNDKYDTSNEKYDTSNERFYLFIYIVS